MNSRLTILVVGALLSALLPAGGAHHDDLPMVGQRYLRLTDLGSGATLYPMASAIESNGHPIHHDNVVDEACHYFWIVDNPMGNWCHDALTWEEPTGHVCFVSTDRSYGLHVEGLLPGKYYQVVLQYKLRGPAGLVPMYTPGYIVGYGAAVSNGVVGVLDIEVDLADYEVVSSPAGGVPLETPVHVYFQVMGPPIVPVPGEDTERTSFVFPRMRVEVGAGPTAAAPCLA